ncbi:MAG: hypothetical protein AAF481_06855 [Acidobacteriota bacterium]
MAGSSRLDIASVNLREFEEQLRVELRDKDWSDLAESFQFTE